MERDDLLSNGGAVQVPDQVVLHVVEYLLGVHGRVLDHLFLGSHYS